MQGESDLAAVYAVQINKDAIGAVAESLRLVDFYDLNYPVVRHFDVNRRAVDPSQADYRNAVRASDYDQIYRVSRDQRQRHSEKNNITRF